LNRISPFTRAYFACGVQALGTDPTPQILPCKPTTEDTAATSEFTTVTIHSPGTFHYASLLLCTDEEK